MHSKQDIENAARLVQEYAKVWPYIDGTIDVRVDGMRDWQPWADTEAGRSDALVLLAAVKRFECTTTDEPTKDLFGALRAVSSALASGNVQQIQAATFAAAVAIGAHMKGVEGE